MAKKSFYSYQKSQREKLRQHKKQEKLARRQEAKDQKTALAEQGIDSDIADIVPGPQPLPEKDE
jgi:hypothetical protein